MAGAVHHALSAAGPRAHPQRVAHSNGRTRLLERRNLGQQHAALLLQCICAPLQPLLLHRQLSNLLRQTKTTCKNKKQHARSGHSISVEKTGHGKPARQSAAYTPIPVTATPTSSRRNSPEARLVEALALALLAVLPLRVKVLQLERRGADTKVSVLSEWHVSAAGSGAQSDACTQFHRMHASATQPAKLREFRARVQWEPVAASPHAIIWVGRSHLRYHGLQGVHLLLQRRLLLLSL